MIALTAGKSLSSHDHLFNAVTVWYVGLPFGPATAGPVDVANIENAERRMGEAEKRFDVALFAIGYVATTYSWIMV